jgi:gliding motility-associated-like protein
MIAKIKWITLLLWIFCLTDQLVFSQPFSSKNNYTGTWEAPESWDPTWAVPQTNISGYDITINGYITVNSSLSFSGTASNLIINDTLVIKGNLVLDNNNDVTVNENGILIVRGNLTIANQTVILANGYIVITGNLIKVSSILQGSFTSNDNPVKVFIGGTISSVGLTDNDPNYPVLNCISPITTPYPSTTCSYGNMTDIKNDPIYSFFQSTCTIAQVTSNSPVCAGNAINFTSSGGTVYSWSGPNGFTSNAQNPSLSNANSVMAGTYTVIITGTTGCTVTDTINVKVNALPVAAAGSNNPVCEGSIINLTSSGGTSYSWSGPNSFISNSQNQSILNATTSMSGIYTVTVTASNGCIGTANVNITVNPLPLVTITSSSNSMCVNDLRTLTGNPTGGTFSISGGPGTIAGNILSATGTGDITFEYSYTGVCSNKATQSITANKVPVPVAGPDQELKFAFETQMKAELSSSETGEWYLVSGSGKISNINSPTTSITELSVGENIFLWKVRSGNCEAGAEVKITVYDLFIPSVITPNNDGKNDLFQVGEIIGRVEMIIFNQWGIEEYTNDNYINDWDGRNNKGKELPNDTYFYLLKFENGKIKQGSVLIKR